MKGDDQEYRIRGAGRREGPGVEFHEKEPASADDDTPVCKITERGDGQIVAEPPAVPFWFGGPPNPGRSTFTPLGNHEDIFGTPM